LTIVLAGCIAESEPNNTGGQAQDNNKYPIALNQAETYTGDFPAGDTVDYWRFNPQSGQLQLSGTVAPWHRMNVGVERCSKLNYATPTSWPTCHSWISVWSSDVGSEVATTRQGFVVPVQTAAILQTTGCFVFKWDGCDSPYHGHEFDWWRVRVQGYNGGDYTLTVVLS
jgi:hypothetical protein